MYIYVYVYIYTLILYIYIYMATGFRGLRVPRLRFGRVRTPCFCSLSRMGSRFCLDRSTLEIRDFFDFCTLSTVIWLFSIPLISSVRAFRRLLRFVPPRGPKKTRSVILSPPWAPLGPLTALQGPPRRPPWPPNTLSGPPWDLPETARREK